MTRKLAWVGFSYMAGLFLASFLGSAVSASAAAVLIAGAAVLIILCKKKNLPSGAVSAVVCCIFIAAGLAVYTVYRSEVYEKAISFDKSEVSFSGKIISADSVSGGKTAFTAKGRINGKYPAGVVLYSDSISAEAGDSIVFVGKASRFVDSYVFSSEKYNRSKGIYLSFYGGKDISVTENRLSVLKLADRCRNYLIDKIDVSMPEAEGSLMKAMLLGDRSDMDTPLRTALYRSGIGHIMAVSGIHMTIIYTSVSLFLSSLERLSKRTVTFISLLTAGFFCVMSGLSVSAVRAFIMLFILGLGECIGHESDTLNSLGIAAIVITAANPFSAADNGLILSFAGVIGAGVIAPAAVNFFTDNETERKYRKYAKAEGIRNTFIVSLCAYIAALPVSIIIFDEVSAISPITNMLLVPLCTLALLIGAAYAVTGGILPVLPVSALLCRVVIAVSEVIASKPPLFISSGNFYLKLISAGVCALVLSMMFFMRDTLKAAYIGAICSLFMILGSVFVRAVFPSDTVTVAYVHGGGSAAAIVSYGSRAAVFDMGDGSKAADKYLKERGIYNIDMVLLTEDISSEAVSYNDTFRYSEISSYFVYGDGLISQYPDFKDKVHTVRENETYSGGYYTFRTDGDKGTEIYIGDTLFYIPREKSTDREAFAVFLAGRGNFEINNAQNVFTDGKGSYFSDGAEIYDGYAAEYIFSGKNIKRRVIFDGGNK